MKALGVIMIIIGCLTGLPGFLLLIWKPVIAHTIAEMNANLPLPAVMSDAIASASASASQFGVKLTAAGLAMIGGGYYLTRPNNEPEDKAE